MADKITQQTFFNNNDGIVAYAEQIKDRHFNKLQGDINKEQEGSNTTFSETLSSLETKITELENRISDLEGVTDIP